MAAVKYMRIIPYALVFGFLTFFPRHEASAQKIQIDALKDRVKNTMDSTKSPLIIFGKFCNHCSDVNSNMFSVYYLDHSNEFNRREIEVKTEGYDLTIDFDTVYRAEQNANRQIVTYATQNSNVLKGEIAQFYRVIYPGNQSPGSTVSDVSSDGWCYLLGLGDKKEMKYVYFPTDTDMNLLFDKANHLWILYSMIHEAIRHVD